jgi:hypothetical protein
MSDIVGLDFLINGLGGGADDTVNLDSLNLPTMDMNDSGPPKLVPSFDSVGQTKTWDGVENLNAEPFLDRAPPRRMADEHIQRKKYEILRKFERLARLNVPLRKRFTMDSPLEEMEMELEFIKKEKDMDRSVQQFSEWFVTGMGGLEWSSKNVPLVKAFGLQLNGLSTAAQMKVGDMEEDFEELYELYGDKLKMHPLVRIPIRTCMMVYTVHMTNQLIQQAPIPNIDQVLRENPRIAQELATASMKQQTSAMKQQPPTMTASNPMSGLQNFMSSMMPPPPPPQNVNRAPPKSAPIKVARPIAPPPVKEMSMPSIPDNINALLEKVNIDSGNKKVTLSSPSKKGGSTGKHSVSIKL